MEGDCDDRVFACLQANSGVECSEGRSKTVREQAAAIEPIEVDVTGFFTTHHYLQAEWGDLGELTFPAFSQGATYEALDGRKIIMQKSHWLGTAHEMIEGGSVRGRADRPGLLRRDIALQLDGRDYWLEPEGVFKQGWFLLDAERRILIEIQPRGVFKQGAYLMLREPVELDLVAFAYYLVHMRKQEDAGAVAATSAS
jgi:hypothetical protein